MSTALVDFRSRVSRGIAHGRIALPVVDTDGSRPVVFALENEPLVTLVDRLRAIGGYANVFVSCDSGIRQLAVVDSRSAIPIPSDDLTSEQPGPLTSVGMFLDSLTLHPNGVVLLAVNPANPVAVREFVHA